jgi:hypothetical protein
VIDGGNMTPNSFDIDTCKEVVGDDRMRVIEAKARRDADNGILERFQPAEAYWDKVRSIMEYVIYTTAHKKRMERVARMKEREKDNA